MTILQPQEIVNQRYQLERQLGQNAGRETWLAKDLQQENELVVVKLLAFGGNVQWEDLKLFEREANVLKQLNHPRIPKYRDYFSIDDRSLWFGLVQEYIQGKSLREYIAQGHKFTESQVKKIAIAVLEILIYLHELSPQVLHRDIKPSNLIFTNSEEETPNIYLVDFGAVQDKASAEGKSFTVVGTYGYAPMEQYGGRAVAASDLYALGATLIYLLTGISPADLPQDDEAKIVFRDRTSASSDFVKWIQKLIEPTIKKRLTSARNALASLQNPQPSAIISKPPAERQRLPSAKRSRIYPPENTNIQVKESEGQLRIIIPNHFWSLVGISMIIGAIFLFLGEPIALAMQAMSLLFNGLIFWSLTSVVSFLLVFSVFKTLTTSHLEINDLEICLGRYLFGRCYWQRRFRRESSLYVEPAWIMMPKKYNNLISWLIWLSSDKNDDNSIKSNIKVNIMDNSFLLSINNMRPTEVIWLIQVIEEFQSLNRRR